MLKEKTYNCQISKNWSFDRLEQNRDTDVIKAFCMIHWELIKKQLHLDAIRFLGWEGSWHVEEEDLEW